MRLERAFKMKRMLTLLLTVLLLTMPACAAQENPTQEATGGSILLAAVSEGENYTDVPADAWYAGAVAYVSESGLMNGVGDGRFDPDGAFTRAQLSTVLYRIAGEPSVDSGNGFTDVAPGAWYAKSAAWAKQSRVINGIGGGRFAPDTPVTQEMLVTMLWRMEKEPQSEAATDASGYAAEAVGWAHETGIAPETKDYTFSPRENATRAQVAELLQNYLNREERPEMDGISLTVDGRQLTVEWADNASVDALRELLKDGPLTIELSQYGGFEQVGSLGTSLPRSDVQTTTEPGDIVLYSGSSIVIFYGSNSWAYTRLGKIIGKNREELKDLFGGDNVVAVLSLSEGKAETGVFDFSTKTVHLNSGYDMPILGLGTWTLSNDQAEDAVYHALKDGYRLIDTARYYGNEAGVGRGIRKAIREGIVKREDVFVTSKVMPSDYNRAAQGIDDSLRDLGLDYLDLMLIHQPGSDDKAVYQALEQGVRDGKIHSIGISNYYTTSDFDEVLSYAEITPAVVQNENHLYYQNTALRDYVKRYGTVVESWYPFGGRGHTQEHFGNETIGAIAGNHGKTAAQVILRWQLQAGFIAIPGSGDPDHIAENYGIFNFELSADEMARIAALDRQQRYESW